MAEKVNVRIEAIVEIVIFIFFIFFHLFEVYISGEASTAFS